MQPIGDPLRNACPSAERIAGETPAAPPEGGDIVYRHRLPVRLLHWANALAVFVMLMSGLMIFSAHPHLYWGQYVLGPIWRELRS